MTFLIGMRFGRYIGIGRIIVWSVVADGNRIVVVHFLGMRFVSCRGVVGDLLCGPFDGRNNRRSCRFCINCWCGFVFFVRSFCLWGTRPFLSYFLESGGCDLFDMLLVVMR